MYAVFIEASVLVSLTNWHVGLVSTIALCVTVQLPVGLCDVPLCCRPHVLQLWPVLAGAGAASGRGRSDGRRGRQVGSAPGFILVTCVPKPCVCFSQLTCILCHVCFTVLTCMPMLCLSASARSPVYYLSASASCVHALLCSPVLYTCFVVLCVSN